MESIMTDIKIYHGSGNVYKDLGFPDAEELQAKAFLASRIMSIIKKKKWTQKKAAEKLGITQPKISLLSRGRFSGFSIGKLINMLNMLHQDIEIIIKKEPSSKRQRLGHVVVTYA